MESSSARAMEEHLRIEHVTRRTLIDALPNLIYVKGLDSRYVMVNRAMACFLGVSESAAAVGKTDHAFYPAEVAAQLIANEQHVMQSGQSMVDYEELLPCPASGETFWISTTRVPVRDHRGVVVGLIGIGRDITARKVTEETQRARLVRLERQQRTIVTLATQWPNGMKMENLYASVAHAWTSQRASGPNKNTISCSPSP